ncbi:MAG: hypothetical protein K2K01_01140 [Eubacterium sp.]|nr:hypothetical protein [Eubacterium sp.]
MIILIVIFDDLYTAMKAPIRLKYNIEKMWLAFYEWTEYNQTHLRHAHQNDLEIIQGEERFLVDSNDFIYWMKNYILEKDEYIRVLEQNVDRTYINNKYPKNKRYILYFENSGSGYLD